MLYSMALTSIDSCNHSIDSSCILCKQDQHQQVLYDSSVSCYTAVAHVTSCACKEAYIASIANIASIAMTALQAVQASMVP